MNALSTERRVLTYGIFDGLDVAHVRLLKRLAAMGDRLIIGLATDAHCASLGHTPDLTYEARREILLACRYVDHVIPEDHQDQKRTDIVNYNISLFAMSDKWAGAFDDLNELAQVLYLPQSDITWAATATDSVRAQAVTSAA